VARPEQEQLGWRASAGRLAGGTGGVDARELRCWSGAGGAGVEQQRVQVLVALAVARAA
jgi:hypothetical protein